MLFNEPMKTTGQPLTFSNGFRTSHSVASRAMQKYITKVESGKIVIEGLTATFVNGDNRVEGIQRTAKKTLALLK